jgi:hypothetical protein
LRLVLLGSWYTFWSVALAAASPGRTRSGGHGGGWRRWTTPLDSRPNDGESDAAVDDDNDKEGCCFDDEAKDVLLASPVWLVVVVGSPRPLPPHTELPKSRTRPARTYL